MRNFTDFEYTIIIMRLKAAAFIPHFSFFIQKNLQYVNPSRFLDK